MDYSFIRIRINDKEVYRNGGDYKINLLTDDFYDSTKEDVYSMVRKFESKGVSTFIDNRFVESLNADILGENCSSFYPLELRVWGKLNNNETIDSIWDNVKEKVFPYSDFFRRTPFTV